MTIHLQDQRVEPTKRDQSESVVWRRGKEKGYGNIQGGGYAAGSGAAMVEDCRAAVSAVCGAWGRTAKDSDHERDALLQSLAVWALEHPAKIESLDTRERRALYRAVLSQDLIRDSRQWQDSLEGRALLRTRARTAGPGGNGKRRVMVLSDASVSDRAERSREHDRKRDAAKLFAKLPEHREGTSTPTQADGTDWLETSAHQEQERKRAESLPPAALAEHSRELAAAMLERITSDLAERPNPIDVDRRSREALLTALLVASGEHCTQIAAATGCGIATAKRRSARGGDLLRLTLASGQLRAIRRECAAELGLVDWSPDSVEDIDAKLGIGGYRNAIDATITQERRTASAYLAGSIPRAGKRQRGSARDVLAYMALIERVTSADAYTLDTQHGHTIPRAERPRPTTRRRIRGGSPSGQAREVLHHIATFDHVPSDDHARRCWPDLITAGQAHYSQRHPAVVAELEAKVIDTRDES